MEWYIPITIIPGVGMFIMSTASLMIALNTEIRELNEEKKKYYTIILDKIVQLKRLNYAMIVQYIATFLFLIGGVLGEITQNPNLIIYLVLAGVLALTLSIGFLIIYGLKSVKIRQKHLTL